MKINDISTKYLSISLLLSTAITFFATSCQQVQYRRCQGAAWNTAFNITYSSPTDLDDSIHMIFAEVEMSLSPFNPQSRISRINANATDTCDAWIAHVFAISQRVNRLSAGMFDPTASPLINLWGFGYAEPIEKPTDQTIAEALRSVGIGQCAIIGNTLAKKTPETTFNFSAVTKGFGSDLMGEMLLRNGSENYMVEIGGEIAVRGKNPKGKPWRVAIDAPVEGSLPGQEGITTITLTDCGMATSGNYRNFRTDADGRRIGHTISPVTGRPVATDVLSATVIAPTCAVADAFATAFMAVGSEQALSIAEAEPDIECVLVIAAPDGATSLLLSSGILTSGSGLRLFPR